MFQRSSFKIFISTHSLIKHIQFIKRQYIIHSKTHTEKLKTLIQGLSSSGSDEDLFHFTLDCPEYTPIRNNYLNLITERFPGLAFLELSPFDKMQFLIGDVNFSLDTNIGLFFDKIGKTMLQKMFYASV
jgi:hypothetical protein